MTPSGAYAPQCELKVKFLVCIEQIYSKRATTNVRNQKFLWHLVGIPLGKLLSYTNESFVKTFAKPFETHAPEAKGTRAAPEAHWKEPETNAALTLHWGHPGRAGSAP